MRTRKSFANAHLYSLPHTAVSERGSATDLEVNYLSQHTASTVAAGRGQREAFDRPGGTF